MIHILTVISFSSWTQTCFSKPCGALTVNISTQQYPLDEPEHMDMIHSKQKQQKSCICDSYLGEYLRQGRGGRLRWPRRIVFFGVQWHWALTAAAAARFGLLWRKIRLTCRRNDQSAAGWGGTQHLVSNEKPEWHVYLSSVPQELSRRQWDSARVGGRPEEARL